MRRQVKVLSGIPGSGKSWYASKLVREDHGTGNTDVCSADDFFVREDGGELKYMFDPSKLSEAHAWCFRRFIAAMNDRVELIIVDNTNMTLWEASPYVLGAQAFGYDVEFVRIKRDLVQAHAAQVHGVPMTTIQRMVSRMEEPLPWWKSTTVFNNVGQEEASCEKN